MLTLTNVNVVAGRTLAAAAVAARNYSSMVFMESDGSTPTPTPEAYVLQYVGGAKLATASPPMEVRVRKYICTCPRSGGDSARLAAQRLLLSNLVE